MSTLLVVLVVWVVVSAIATPLIGRWLNRKDQG